jgi:hypothetical protein
MIRQKTANTSPFMILAPANTVPPVAFQNVSRDQKSYDRILADMQKMRGRIALKEGAVRKKDLRPDLRHEMTGDRESWHLIRLGERGKIIGCARILVHSDQANYFSLRVSRTPLATNSDWRNCVRSAVEEDMRVARESEMKLVEPGGWVIEEPMRGSPDAVVIALSAFAWSQLVGGCLAYVTATVKHGSSSILRRLGGSSLEFKGKQLPKYYDPEYGCDMEILKFKTKSLNSRFESTMAPLRTLLAMSPVVQAEQAFVTLAA